jgi:hypothetical protein
MHKGHLAWSAHNVQRRVDCLYQRLTFKSWQLWRAEMTWGIPTTAFLQLHVFLSLAAIAIGFGAAWGIARGHHLGGWAAAFLVTTFLTGITGFPLPPFGMTPGRIIGVIMICALIAASASLYIFALVGANRLIYVIASVFALYLNVFVAIVQAFQKIAPLRALAPTQTELPFALAQVAALFLFIVLGFLGHRRFRPSSVSAASLA